MNLYGLGRTFVIFRLEIVPSTFGGLKKFLIGSVPPGLTIKALVAT